MSGGPGDEATGTGRRAAARGPDARLLRRTRLRLIAWSGGSTLVLLVILGGLLYWATAARLRSESIDQLAARAAGLRVSTVSVPAGEPAFQVPVTADPGSVGMIVGGPMSGTIAFVMPVDGTSGVRVPFVIGGASVVGPAGSGVGVGGGPVLTTTEGPGEGPVPATDPIAVDLSDGPVVTEQVVGGLPVRVLMKGIDMNGQPMVIQVVADRTAEVRALETLLLVLVVGGLLVVLGAAGAGYVYAGRALVPIRRSLERQREFAADASHELRTPLAIVSTALEHLRRRRDDPEAVSRAIADLEKGSQRMTGLVDDLLFLARTDADAVELAHGTVDLAEAAADALTACETLAGERSVLLRLDIEPAPVIGDEARLRQLAGILLDNAIHHAPAGSAVTVRVRPGATLEVEDAGPGIRPEDLPHVFRRFWRAADAPPGGTGLGLAIAEWIATSHRGRILAETRTEGGARFRVTLPGA